MAQDPRLRPGALLRLMDTESDFVFMTPASDFPDLSYQNIPNGTLVVSLGEHKNILQDSYVSGNEDYRMVKIMSHLGVGVVFLSECEVVSEDR